jgi:hypothetical protein
MDVGVCDLGHLGGRDPGVRKARKGDPAASFPRLATRSPRPVKAEQAAAFCAVRWESATLKLTGQSSIGGVFPAC